MATLYARTAPPERSKNFGQKAVIMKKGKPTPVEGAVSYFVQTTMANPGKGISKGTRWRYWAGEDIAEGAIQYHRAEAEESGAPAQVVQDLVANPPTPTGRRTVVEAVAKYLAETKVTKSASTLDKYTRHLGHLQKFCQTKATYLDQVSRELLLNFISYLREQVNSRDEHLGERSVHQHLMTIVTFLNAAGFKKLLRKGDWPKFTKPPVKTYTEEQIERLRKACGRDEIKNTRRFLLEFLLGTGMRKEEARYAEYTDVKGQVISVMDKPHLGFSVKTYESRDITIPDDLVKRIKARQEKSGSKLIFPGETDKGTLSRNRLWQIVQGIAAQVVGPKIDADCHTFRRTFGTRWATIVPLQDVMVLMGHKDPKTTLQYLGLAKAQSPEMRKAANKVAA